MHRVLLAWRQGSGMDNAGFAAKSLVLHARSVGTKCFESSQSGSISVDQGGLMYLKMPHFVIDQVSPRLAVSTI